MNVTWIDCSAELPSKQHNAVYLVFSRETGRLGTLLWYGPSNEEQYWVLYDPVTDDELTIFEEDEQELLGKNYLWAKGLTSPNS